MVSALSPLNTQAQPDQTLNNLLAGRDAFQQSQLSNQAIQRNQMMMDRAPIENAQQDKMAEQQISRVDYDTAVQRLSVINRLAKKVKELPQDQRQGFVQSLNAEMLQSVGIDPAQVSGVQLDDQSLDALITQTGAALPEQQQGQYRKESVSTNQGLMVFDPSTGEYVPATGSDGQPLSAAQYDPSLQKQISTAKQTGKNESDLQVKPEIARSIAMAEQQVKELGDKRTASAQNQITMNMYETAMQGLVSGLEGTETGAIAGRIPAITADQQIADGAVAAMLPILKATFRTAGEGTFTDKDQELLEAMVPTRRDNPAARASKINNINAIIAAKLNLQGMNDAGLQPSPSAPKAAGKYTIEVMD